MEFDSRSSSQLLLLGEFRTAKEPSSLNERYWSHVLQHPVGDVVAAAVQRRLLLAAPLAAKLDALFPMARIRLELKQRGLKQAGNKAELIDRLAKADAPGCHELTKASGLLVLSPAGSELVEPFFQQLARNRDVALASSQKCLLAGDCVGAVRLLRAWRDTLAFSAPATWEFGLVTTEDDEVFLAREIMNHRPRYLQDLPDASWPAYQVAAVHSLMAPAGRANRETHLPLDAVEAHPRLKPQQVIDALRAYAFIRRSLKQYEALGGELRVSILGVPDCEVCREITGQVYPLDAVPELPYYKCRRDLGCACSVTAVTKPL